MTIGIIGITLADVWIWVVCQSGVIVEVITWVFTFPYNSHLSIKKTVVLFQPAKGSTASAPKVKVDGKILKNVDSFTYLGSSLSSSNSLDKEISSRIAKASASYGRLQNRVWGERGLSIETKCAVYRAVVLSALLYGCEAWTLYRRHIKLLGQFHQRCRRRIMNKWFHRVSNVRVLQLAKMSSMDALLTLSQLRWAGLRWAGHRVCMLGWAWQVAKANLLQRAIRGKSIKRETKAPLQRHAKALTPEMQHPCCWLGSQG